MIFHSTFTVFPPEDIVKYNFERVWKNKTWNDGVKSCFTHPYYVALISGWLAFELLFHKAHWLWVRKKYSAARFLLLGLTSKA